jgi:lipoprotein-releasing system ATP-binding protein
MTGAGRPRAHGGAAGEVGFVYQFHHLLPEFTRAENIVLPQLANGVARREREERAAMLLDRVGVAERAAIGPRRCRAASSSAWPSAGRWPMRRGCCWPTSRRATSTPRPRTGCSTLMALVRETGMAALIATHNPELAARMDRVLRLEQGVLV